MDCLSLRKYWTLSPLWLEKVGAAAAHGDRKQLSLWNQPELGLRRPLQDSFGETG